MIAVNSFRVFLACLIALSAFGLCRSTPATDSSADAALEAEKRPQVVKNPYADVDWDQSRQYLANFHCHTLYSDGRAEPDELIYRYAEAGYSILSITDHDNVYSVRDGQRDPGQTHETTWPWTRWIDEKPSRVWKNEQFDMETSAFYPDLGDRGMLAIRGNELSQHPHIVSLFNDCGFAERGIPEHRRLRCVQAKGGLSFWAHPAVYIPPERWAGRGWARGVEASLETGVAYFGEYLTRFDSHIAVEFSQRESLWQLTIDFWDALLEAYYREHDLWAIGNDDNHHAQTRNNATLTVVLATELTEEAVKQAIERGHTFVGRYVDPLPRFNRIEVDQAQCLIVVDIDHQEEIVWIKNGAVHHTGNTLDYSEMSDAILRFEVKAGNQSFLSQAFWVK